MVFASAAHVTDMLRRTTTSRVVNCRTSCVAAYLYCGRRPPTTPDCTLPTCSTRLKLSAPTGTPWAGARRPNAACSSLASCSMCLNDWPRSASSEPCGLMKEKASSLWSAWGIWHVVHVDQQPWNHCTSDHCLHQLDSETAVICRNYSFHTTHHLLQQQCEQCLSMECFASR